MFVLVLIKKPLVSSRLGSRIQKLGLDDFESYLALIADPTNSIELQVAMA